MKILFTSMFSVFLLPCTSFACESVHGITGGFRYSIPSFDGFGVYEDSKDKPHLGFALGYSYWYRFNSNFSFRTGLEVTNKSLKFENINGSIEFKYLILEAPAIVQYNFSEELAFFSGVNFASTVFDDCKNQTQWVCENTGDTFTIRLGGQIGLHENGYLDLSYEKALFKLAEYKESIVTNTSENIPVGGYNINYSTVGLSYTYFFK